MVASSLLLSAMVVMTSVNSCSSLQGASGFQGISKIANIAATASEIANVLGPTLGLNTSQKSATSSIISDYIGGTNNIASLFNTDKKSYLSQLTSLNSGTLGKLKTVFTAAQYAKLLGLGGKKSSASSLVSNLSGGNTLSSGAVSVLTGLLASGLK